MIFFRRINLLIFPVLFAIILGIAKLQMIPPLAGNTQEIASALLSGDSEAANSMLTSQLAAMKQKLDQAIADPNQTYIKRLKLMDHLTIITIVGGFCLLAMFIPAHSSAQSKSNDLTFLVIGFVVANFAIGFNHLRWDEFFLWAILGFAGSLGIVLIRDIRKRPNNLSS